MDKPVSQRQALVVDDSRSARFAMRKYLERHRYEVATVENGADALGYLREHRPLVVFLDHLMPGLSGLEVLRALKNDPHTVAIPVVICTSVERPEMHQEARGSGALEVLQKPPSLDRLAELLSVLESAAQNDPAPVAILRPVAAVVAAPPVLPEAVNRYSELYNEINAHLRRLTEDIFVQISELKTQLARIDSDGLTREENDALRQIAREEAESLQQSVRSEIDLVRRRLDTMDLLQRRDREEVLQAARQVATREAQTVAAHTVTDAVTKLSHKLTDTLLKAMGR